MDGSFVKELHEQMRCPVSIQGGNEVRLVAPNDWKDITPSIPTTKPIVGSTLSALIGFVQNQMDEGAVFKPFIAVQATVVSLLSQIGPEESRYRRNTHVVVEPNFQPFAFGTYLDSEDFFVGLQSKFVPTAELERILELVASIKESVVRDTVDNGVAQEVVASRGVVLRSTARVPNPVTLRPFRTFMEVEQPESRFTLRLKTGTGDKPMCALFESDGGLWQLAAIRSIKEYLAEKVSIQVIG